MSVSRRRFFTRSGALAATALGLPAIARSAESTENRPGQKPRHIIHLVSDGMSMGTLACADQFSLLVRKRGLTWLELCKQPAAFSAWMNMRSLNSIVTDSSAASSCWGGGSRILNGAVNRLPDGRDLVPLCSLFGQAGWKRGLVTTTEITHATPAGFAANADSRDEAQLIAKQYFQRRIDVLLGGGKKFFNAKDRADKRDLTGEFKAAGYSIMGTASDLTAAPLDKSWLGLFGSGHLPFTIDQMSDSKLMASVPTLAAMTRAALAKLEREDHFILQVEGGRVDHACHNCDAASAMWDQLAFDEALDVCVDFQKRHPDTLIIVTTDHGNGNPGLNGMGSKYAGSSPAFARLRNVRRSFSEMIGKLEKTRTDQEIRELIFEATNYKPSREKAAMLSAFLHKKGKSLYDAMNSGTTQLGQLLANYTGIGWAGSAHTGDYVPLIATGPGAERFRGFIQGTDVFSHYVALAGIDYKNPSMPLVADTGPSAAEVEKPETYV